MHAKPELCGLNSQPLLDNDVAWVNGLWLGVPVGRGVEAQLCHKNGIAPGVMTGCDREMVPGPEDQSENPS